MTTPAQLTLAAPRRPEPPPHLAGHAWRADLPGRLLAERGRGWVHVDPIPLSPTPGSPWTVSTPQVESAFVAALDTHGVPVTVRDTRGSDIDGACGQLAALEA